MVTEDEVAEIVLGLPGTEQGTSYRQPDFKLNKKFFTCVRQARESDAGALVLHVDFLSATPSWQWTRRPSSPPTTTATTHRPCAPRPR